MRITRPGFLADCQQHGSVATSQPCAGTEKPNTSSGVANRKQQADSSSSDWQTLATTAPPQKHWQERSSGHRSSSPGHGDSPGPLVEGALPASSPQDASSPQQQHCEAMQATSSGCASAQQSPPQHIIGHAATTAIKIREMTRSNIALFSKAGTTESRATCCQACRNANRSQ